MEFGFFDWPDMNMNKKNAIQYVTDEFGAHAAAPGKSQMTTTPRPTPLSSNYTFIDATR